MLISEAAALEAAYRNKTISAVFHPQDEMQVKGPKWYFPVGVSAIECLLAGLIAAPTTAINTILDFGCGYGRVGRHLRACFPNAGITFSDIDPVATQFCADTFDGEALRSTNDFGQLAFPRQYDLIWIGSVFTHLDLYRMRVLFTKVFGALSEKGLLLMTTHGARCLSMAAQHPYLQSDRWRTVVADYQRSGFGYAPYAFDSDDRWGVSLTTPGAIWELAANEPGARLIFYKEAGWADHQDAVGWTRVST